MGYYVDENTLPALEKRVSKGEVVSEGTIIESKPSDSEATKYRALF